MNSEQAVAHVISCLEELGIEYMLVGALSCNVYGVPRATADADLVIDLGERNLLDCISILGPEFRLDPQLSFEVLTGSHRNVIHFLPTGFDIELFRLSSRPRESRAHLQGVGREGTGRLLQTPESNRPRHRAGIPQDIPPPTPRRRRVAPSSRGEPSGEASQPAPSGGLAVTGRPLKRSQSTAMLTPR